MNSALDTFYSTAFQGYPFFATFCGAMCLKIPVSFVLQDVEEKVRKRVLCYHVPVHTSLVYVWTPVAAQPPAHPPCIHFTAAAWLDNSLSSPT